ncbi:DUF3857 and transglutaminase domain-containing protein [Mucilaginibacter sp. KACC 22063]|uniref:DUF3857 and transglutaminase domain-containing protein n=1 Tax=Mucilaginibacter sp. KACC 22063 TaxID=3025666 RepID=UPI002365FBDD|nr:DUF3857 domain-containing transglutaminase family protein [Mucilaginibacter sp. KACC 22063]WDF53717.1 DUF3857 domain-containing transglutaminase family protein [Mucilaginibacter sp. KACC 22063]
MRRILAIALILFGSISVKAQEDYSASLIPKELLPYASAVMRNYEKTVEIRNKETVVYHIKEAITVLNRNGAEAAHLGLWYNKGSKIKSIKGMIYDEFNKPISKISSGNFEDQAYIDDYSLFEDNRVKHYNPSVTTYPYTVVYEYETQSNQSLNITPWYPVEESGVAVEKSVYKVICPADESLRYNENNFKGQVETGTTDKGLKTYTWRAANIKAYRDEPYSPIMSNYITSVRVVPQHFVYGGIPGSFTNWEELGKWNYEKLLVDRQKLSLATVEQMKELTANITDPKLKAKAIYEYMQHKTRYVSIQIGIGGYQPFPATDVDQLGYGDCKGLVNYTQALLKAVGINSWYCVVEAGNSKISMKKDFASMDQGNHVILCLPFKNDTTWLECTNQKIPFGYLGSFTDDRTVLACTPEGGRLLHTPKYTTEQNIESRTADVTIAADGTLTGKMLTTFSGSQYNNRREYVDEPFREQAKAVQRIYPINNMEVKSYQLKDEPKYQPEMKEAVQFEAPEYGMTEDDKLIFIVNPTNRAGTLRELVNRTQPVYINRGYTDIDKIVYTIPEGYEPDKKLLSLSIKKDFGSYSANVSLNGNQLVYTRKFQLKDGTYSKDEYSELVDFYQSAEEADHYKMVLVKKK